MKDVNNENNLPLRHDGKKGEGLTKGRIPLQGIDLNNSKTEEVRNQLMAELELVKADQSKAFSLLESEIEDFKRTCKVNAGNLPKFVVCPSSKIMRLNTEMALCSPPQAWRTKCGWYYGKSDFVFLTSEGEATKCQKCQTLAQRT
eukprot:Skav220046  [mRNA]  locus=scaffold2981:340402:340836:- [translate_table: standard]